LAQYGADDYLQFTMSVFLFNWHNSHRFPHHSHASCWPSANLV